MKPQHRDVRAETEAAALHIANLERAIQSGEADLTDTERLSLDRRREQSKALNKYRGDVQQTMKAVEARRWVFRILELCGPNRISHVPGDSHSTAFNDGKRAIANEILLMLFDADQELYSRMQREHLSDLKSEQAARDKSMSTENE